MKRLITSILVAITLASIVSPALGQEEYAHRDKIQLSLDTNSEVPIKIERINQDKEYSVKLDTNGQIVTSPAFALVMLTPGKSNAEIAQESKAKAQLAAAQRPPQIRGSVGFNGDFVALYQHVGAEFGIPWQILAAIHKIETGGSGDTTRSNPSGATGPMQFIPSTWRAYGIDGDGDGHANIHGVVDAVHGAGNYLARNFHKSGSLYQAIWQYNHLDSYVQKVLGLARSYGYIG